MAEVDLDLMLLRELPAEATGRGVKAQVFELRGVETVREALDVFGSIQQLLAQMMDVLVESNIGGGISFQLFQLNRHERDSLRDIVVKLSADACTFLFLR